MAPTLVLPEATRASPLSARGGHRRPSIVRPVWGSLATSPIGDNGRKSVMERMVLTRPLPALMRRSLLVRNAAGLDPLLSFKTGPVNELEALESRPLTGGVGYRAVEADQTRRALPSAINTGRARSRPNGASVCLKSITRTSDHIRLRSAISSSHAATAAAASP